MDHESGSKFLHRRVKTPKVFLYLKKKKKKKNSGNGVVAPNAVDVDGILTLKGLANKEKGKNLLFQHKLLLSWDELERKHKSPVEVPFSIQ